MLDVKKVRTLGEVKMIVRHPVTQADTGATLTIAGPEHPKRREQRFALQRKLRAQYAAGTQKGIDAEDPEQNAIDNLHRIADSILGWTGFGEDGVPMEYTPGRARALLVQPELSWLADQVAAFINDQGNFITPSSGN